VLRAPVILIALSALLVSCAAFSGAAGAGYSGDEAEWAAEEQEAGARRSAAEAAPPPEPGAEVAADSSPSIGRGAGPGTQQPVGFSDGGTGGGPGTVPERPSSEERLRVYSADLELTVGVVEDTRARITEAARSAGGYVESSSGEYITIRVPAERFEDVLARVEDFGAVRSRSVRTADVTEQYADLERRIELSERTRERFYVLLERTSDTEERVEILREIRRLTERIERLTAQLESLDRQIAYSRITVRLTARIQETGPNRGDIPFDWIAGLDPLERTTAEPSGRIDIDFPEDFAVFDTGRFVSAETAEGTRVRVGAVENEPEGDTAFWQKALSFHLGRFYLVEEELEAGAFSGVLFASKGAERFFYLVAVRASGDEITVAEAFFPSAEARGRRLGEVNAALSEVGQ
jgi:hypothetical protein